MKKLSLLVGGVILSTAVMAQKPVDSAPMSLEGQIGYNAASLSFNAPSLRFRYFVTDNIAARVTLGIANSTTTDNFYENPDFSGGTGEYITKNNNFNVGIGAEYHFDGTEKLSPYVGLDIMFGSGKVSTEGTNSDGNVYIADYAETSEAPTSMFGVNLVAGTDYYFAENFYIGLELGLGFGMTTIKEGETSVTNGGTTVSSQLRPEGKVSEFGNNFIGNLRLGWRF